MIDLDDIVIDAKSGVSGAGRALKETMLFAEANEGFRAYGVGAHRHLGEFDQELTRAAGREVHRQLHAAPAADDPRHPGDDLRQGRGRGGA